MLQQDNPTPTSESGRRRVGSEETRCFRAAAKATTTIIAIPLGGRRGDGTIVAVNR